MRTKGFCSALHLCGEIKLMIAEKREYAISDLIANIARKNEAARRRTKSFGIVRNLGNLVSL